MYFYTVRRVILGGSCNDINDICLGESTGCINGLCQCMPGYYARNEQCCKL